MFKFFKNRLIKNMVQFLVTNFFNLEELESDENDGSSFEILLHLEAATAAE